MVNNVLNKYLNTRFQIIAFDAAFCIQNTKDELFFLTSGKKIMELDPFFEIVTYLYNEKIEEECFEMVNFEEQNIIADVVFKIDYENDDSFVLIIDKSDQFSKIQPLKQVHNEQFIENYHSRNKMQLLANEKKNKNEFLASISHDLKNPIHSILSLLDLLGKDKLKGSQAELYKTIYNFSNHLNRLVGDIYDLSSMDTASFKIKPIDFNINDILLDLKTIYSKKFKEKNIKFKVITTGSIPLVINGDANRLFQIVNNLLDNSFKFTEKGKVTLKVEVKKRTKNQVQIQFAVKDTGCGFTLDENQLGAKFKKISSDAQKQGLGLGLSIVTDIVSKMGGSIGFKSEIDEGTTFKVYLPFSLDVVINSTAFVKKELKRTYNVLIVDDNEINKLILLKLLVNHGKFYINTASNGLEALELLKVNSYDLLLTDLYMPGVSGFDVIKKIKTGAALMNPAICIIPISGGVTEDDKKILDEYEISNVLLKPFDERMLFERIYPFVD